MVARTEDLIIKTVSILPACPTGNILKSFVSSVFWVLLLQQFLVNKYIPLFYIYIYIYDNIYLTLWKKK